MGHHVKDTAFFVKKPARIGDLRQPHFAAAEQPYRIVKKVRLKAIDYENFITDMYADRWFIERYGALCREPDQCLLIQCYRRKDGVLVKPQGESHVGYAAYYHKG